jgi:hypothetical protein
MNLNYPISPDVGNKCLGLDYCLQPIHLIPFSMKRILLFILCCGFIGSLHAQVGINGTGNSPDPSAMLDVQSTSSGFLPPRMTSAQRDGIASPASGLIIYNTDTNCLNMWDGSTWRESCFDCTFSPPAATNNGPVCAGTSLQLSATPIIGVTYTWSGPNGFTSNLQNPVISGVTTAASGTYTVTATLGGCTSAPVTTSVLVNAVPASPAASNDGPYCSGNTANLEASTVPGATYSWTGPQGFSSVEQYPVLTGVTAGQAGTYSVTATISGCTSPAGSTSVSIQNIPAQPGSVSGSTSECIQTDGIPYSISSVAGADSYSWTVPSGSAVATGQGSTSVTVDFGSTEGSVCVSANNECGASTPSCLPVTLIGSGGEPSQTFSYSGSIQTFVVPNCVSEITIEAWGAQGGTRGSGIGGLGARVRGDFAVTPGQTLKVVAGEQPNVVCCGSSGAGGGGGSFVWIDGQTTEPLIAAGGGGGGDATDPENGGPGSGHDQRCERHVESGRRRRNQRTRRRFRQLLV